MMRIEGLALSLGELLRRGRFTPARVQRGYKWEWQQQRRLLEDFEASLRRAGSEAFLQVEEAAPLAAEPEAEPYGMDEEDDTIVPLPVESYGLSHSQVRPRPQGPDVYFLGHMVLCSTDAADLFDVYDGQQRLTSVVLLLSALRDALPVGPDRARVRGLLLTEDEKPRLEAPTPGGLLSRISKADGRARQMERENETDRDVRLRTGAARYADKLQRYTLAQRLELLDFLSNRVFVNVSLMEDRRLAETAYLTVNDRGLRLDSVEVVKGHVVQVVSDVRHTDGREVARAWERLQRDAGDAFPAFLATLGFELFRRERAQDYVSDWLDQFEAGAPGAARARTWVMEDLPRKWEVYRKLVTPPEGREDLRETALELRQLTFLPWPEWRAVALRFFEQCQGRDLVRAMRKLKRSCYIMQLAGWEEREDWRVATLSKALAQLQVGRSPFLDPPAGSTEEAGALVMFTDKRARARAGIKVPMDADAAKPIVKLAETLLWIDAGQDPLGYVGDGSLEHVLPIAHRASDWPGFTEDEREHLKGCLGNLCLIPTGLNRELGRDGYAVKRPAYLKLAQTWRSAHDVAKAPDWTADVVRARTERLAGVVLKHLGLKR